MMHFLRLNSLLPCVSRHFRLPLLQMIAVIILNLIAAGYVYADPPRVLHTSFEQYARQQQQHDQQLMQNHISASDRQKSASAFTKPNAGSVQATSQQEQVISKKRTTKNNAVINLNQADELSLANTLIGVGPAKALAIVEYRKQHGRFKRLEDLTLVKGIGPATLEKNRDRLRLD